jgi:hypothetical protein
LGRWLLAIGILSSQDPEAVIASKRGDLTDDCLGGRRLTAHYDQNTCILSQKHFLVSRKGRYGLPQNPPMNIQKSNSPKHEYGELQKSCIHVFFLAVSFWPLAFRFRI